MGHRVSGSSIHTSLAAYPPTRPPPATEWPHIWSNPYRRQFSCDRRPKEPKEPRVNLKRKSALRIRCSTTSASPTGIQLPWPLRASSRRCAVV
jgi:hypothetical protein